MSVKSDVIRTEGAGPRRRRWVPAAVAIQITGHASRETLRKAARYYNAFDVDGVPGWKKIPGTGELEYDLDGCLAYAGREESDFAELLAPYTASGIAVIP